MDEKLYQLKQVLEPIVEVIEKNRRSISLLINDIEFDSKIKFTDQEFDILSTIEGCINELSKNNEGTNYEAFIEMIDKYD